MCNLGQFARFPCKKIRQTVQSDKHWWKKIRQTPKTIRQTVSNSSDNLTNMFTVCRIFFCVCRIVLLARLLFDGLAQKSWQKPKNLINFHKNDYWAKSSYMSRDWPNVYLFIFTPSVFRLTRWQHPGSRHNATFTAPGPRMRRTTVTSLGLPNMIDQESLTTTTLPVNNAFNGLDRLNSLGVSFLS